ncbi:hypothetical protein D9V86_08130 [Bacteroidetes/Chlorobi group bacterium ChocPot_Mid]|jgi:hypothetical protein|nr:MAG: hypothetical protein D9V86_08130 [Bacteroidetes/Chlorobi group bacterium ChocPot_Mid]
MIKKTNLIELTVIIILILGSLTKLSAVERLLQPYNLNFEEGVNGLLPKGWTMAKKFTDKGFKAGTNTQTALTGRNSLQFSFEAIIDTVSSPDSSVIFEDTYGFVYQAIDAKDYRNKKVKFRAAIFTENLSDSANCRLRLTTHFKSEKPSENFISDSITLVKGWHYYEITCLIDKEADIINYGFLLSGFGYILIDDASFEYDKEYTELNVTNTNPLSPQQLENLSAFARLFGYVRYFYPGFEVADNDWESFALNGVQYIEQAGSKQELTDRLNKLFLPIAPGLSIYEGKNRQNFEKRQKPPEALKDIALSWLHIGAYLGIPVKNFSNQLKNIYLPTRQREGPCIQVVDALALKGKKIRFSAYVKTDTYQPEGHAQLWIGIDDADKEVVLFNTTIDEAPIKDTKWTLHSLEADVPKNASIIRLGLVMLGDGKVWFDNTSLKIVENGKELEKNYLKNPDFEDIASSGILLGWTFPESATKAGYTCKTSNTEKYQGKSSLQINTDERTRIIMPKLSEDIRFEIGQDLWVNMPLNNFVDSAGTLPKPTNQKIAQLRTNDFIMNPGDRYSRFAVFTLLWNVNRHFAIGVNENLKWEEILNEGLEQSAVSSGKEFINVLNRMLAKINDGQARAWLNNNEIIYGLPLLWKWVGNDLVIYQNEDTLNGIPLGSVVKKINGKTPEELAKNLAEINTGSLQWKKLRSAALLRAGDKDEEVILEIMTPDNETKQVNLKKSHNVYEIEEIRLPQFHIINDDSYYFDLTRITDRGMKNIVNDIKDRLPKAKNIIFDLRGYSANTPEFLGMFLNAKISSVSRKYPVFTKPGGKPCTWFEIGEEIKPMNPYIKTNVYFLIDERTSGGAEIIASLAKRYKIGKLVGSVSSGTADEVLGINLPGEFNASIVAMLVELPGSNIDFKKGIEPDIKISPKMEYIIKGRDEVLEYVYGLFVK